ncbi:MAG: hypothetical protein HC886_04330 [Leptolyngbyaceae cyanobacterium SM1_1_3]|nr:hypothetical protein [Leptolyngbyaceae cyanobacterium SM1_1_3]NJM85420.1 hypothetical protein [Leptolyngbyaceae cyanobacterium RM2_2_21]NJN02192.1 hypothetical protein [Leptolyngbyaceae cyanobacterium RM1_1_2]NJO10345.1 hypothetical protein [Leptolyngbyaceae cyanobacterium SL_1_1]
MKYFFLSDSWRVGRVWEFGGLWDELAWQRKPHIQCLTLFIEEQQEKLWLYQVEDTVLMVEVKPTDPNHHQSIGQVMLKRLISADQAIARLCEAETLCNLSRID